MSNKLYDTLKWIATVGLPAITALWLTVGQIWQIPYTEAIGATMAAITTCACALLGISSIRYQLNKKGGDSNG